MTEMTLAQEIARVAAGRVHKLAPYQVDGSHEISPRQYRGMMDYLLRCKERPTREQEIARQFPVASAAEARERANRPSFGDIPGGFYATPSATGNNDLDYWKVTEGSRAGVRFVKRVVGGGTSSVPATIPLSRPQQAAALRAIIDAGIEESSNLYADKESRCVDCGRQLTDEASQAARRGPVCRGKR